MLDYTIIAQYQEGNEVSWLSKIRNDGAEIALQEIIALYRNNEEALLGTPYHDPDEAEPWVHSVNHAFSEDRAFVILWCEKDDRASVENHVEVWYCDALEEKDRGFWVDELVESRSEHGKIHLNCDAVNAQPISFDFRSVPHESLAEGDVAAWEIPMDLEDGEIETWEPMMNFLYPLPSSFEIPRDWRSRLVCTTIIQYDGSFFLALTGGGMDLRWELCESYIALGYWPPADLCNLPAIAGRGDSDRDRAIVACCRESARIMIQWCENRVSNLEHIGCPHDFIDSRTPSHDDAKTLARKSTMNYDLDSLLEGEEHRLTTLYTRDADEYLRDLECNREDD